MISNFEARRLALRSGAASVALGLGLISAPATAQVVLGGADTPVTSAPTEAQADNDAGAIVVTGSRIARRDLTSASPLAIVSSEEFKLSGAVNVEQVINTLPQVIPGSTSFSNNPGGGVATLNLRGLGETRTLVLVNGRRYMFFDTQQLTDLNTIPQFLIDGVDVVTGGASAVYGSDAIAGVVNFRLRNDLQGVEVGAQYSLAERGDGARLNAHIATGTSFADDRGHITTYADYYKRKSIFQGARAFSEQALGDGTTGLVPLGSATTPSGRFAVTGAAAAGTPFDTFGATTLGGTFTQAGVARPYVGATDAYNYAVDNYLQVPQERFLLGAYANYEFSDAVNVYTEFSFANNRVENELAPTPVTGTFSVNLNNNAQYLSAGTLAQLRQIDSLQTGVISGISNSVNDGLVTASIARRINETGSRNSLDERNAFRVVAGVNGKLPVGDLSYDAYYSYARTRNANVQEGNISRRAFSAGLLSGSINIFGPGSLTPEMVDSISILSQNNDISVLQVATANINGSLFNTGLAADNVAFSAGVERRSVSSRFIPDTALASGDVIGFNAGLPTAGSYNVKEVFGELRVPLISDRAFFNRLELNGAGRISDYSLGGVGTTYTYTGGAEWSPIRDITFRGQYSRAVRAPNVGELFGGLSNGFPAATDPCSNRGAAADRTDVVRALCLATGVPASAVFTRGVQPNAQVEGTFGGSADLGEETSDTYTAGVVLRPSFLPGVNVTADYFNIKIDGVITSFGGGLNNILQLCYLGTQDINSPFCQAINRDPSNGQIGGQFLVSVLNANSGSLKTEGVDLQADYTQRFNFGLLGEASRLNLAFLGTWTKKNDFTPVTGFDTVFKCAGFFGSTCGNPQSKYKFTTRASFIDGPMTTSVRVRYLSSTQDDQISTNGVDPADLIVPKLSAKTYTDLAFAFDVTDAFNLSMGVNNLFDIQPQRLGDSQQQANTFPGVYDPLGRDFFISANFRF